MRTMFTKVAILAMVLQMASAVFAGTTGNVSGVISDSNGDPLPGVTILLTSPQLIGSRTAVTDASGKYRAVFLPPGNYTVTATFTGFRTQKASLKVEIDGNHSINLQLEVQNSIEDELVVTADIPVIDQTSTTSGANISSDFFTKIPTGRRVSDIMTLAPGVSTSDVDGSYRINGASGPENQYIVDGVNTTSIELGGESANLNFDFIQEVQVKTGGYNAEFGRATGGILNVITKSGGNEFEGSVYAFKDDRDSVASAQQIGVGDISLGTDRNDYGVTVGGPIIKDKLWFFVGVNPQSRTDYEGTPTTAIPDGNGTTSWADVRGETETAAEEEDVTAWAAKLTWQLNESNTIVFSGNTAPEEEIFRDNSGTTDRDRLTKIDTTNYILKWNSILSNVFTLDVSYAYHEETSDDSSLNGNNGSRVFHRTSTPRGDVGGLGFVENYDATRDDFNIKLGAYLGNHDLKVGFQFEETNFTDRRDYTGLGLVRADFREDADEVAACLAQPGGCPTDDYNDIAAHFRLRNFADGNLDVIPQNASTDNEYNSIFIQDSWAVTPNLVLNLGMRIEEQKLLNSTGGTYHSFDDNDAPRLGFTWDFLGDGRSKLYGHWGRFYQTLPMDINNRAAAPEILLFNWYAFLPDSPRDLLEWDDAEIQRVVDNSAPWLTLDFGSGSTAIDQNSKATNHDEIILGIEYEFKTDWTVGFKYIGRSINEAIEDISFDAGDNYIIGNPGEDVTFTNGADDDFVFFDFHGEEITVAAGETYTLAADRIGFPKVVRDYSGYEFLLRKAYRDDYQFQFSYVHSSTRGNYVGSTVQSGQVDPGITALFDIPSTTVNGNGLLPQHRRHQLKFDGSYEFDFGLLTGLSYRYTSGQGQDALGDPDVGNGAYSEFHLLQRGSAGALPALTSVDLHLDYTMKFSGKMNLSLYADIFNIFNFQEATELERDFSFATPDDENLRRADAPWNNGVAAPDLDIIQLANRYYAWAEGQFSDINELIEYYENDNNGNLNGSGVREALGWESTTYGKPLDFQLGRRTRFGVRFRF